LGVGIRRVQAGVQIMQTTGITRVRFGEIVKPQTKKTIQPAKATVTRNLLFKLEQAIGNDARVLEKMKTRGILTTRLESLIEDLFREVVTLGESFPNSGYRIPKMFYSKVQNLSTAINFFESECQKELYREIKFRVRILRILKCLIDDIKHFVIQFNMNYSSVEVELGTNGQILPPSQEHIPYRKTDLKRKEFFYALLVTYKNPIGEIIKFPRHKTIEYLMEQAGYKFPDRTYRLYKTQIKNGTFDYLVQ